jgi:hypothetical protein
MKPAGSADNDRLATFIVSLNLSGLTMTRVILWLAAITIVSFAIGFGILALSGGFSPGQEPAASPFNKTAFRSANTTAIPRDDAPSGEIRIVLGTGDLTVRGGAPEDSLIEALVYAGSPAMQPEYTVSMNGSAKRVAMTETGHKKKDWVFANAPQSWDNTWDVRLNDVIPFAVAVNAGAGDCTILLGETNLTSLAVNTGAGDTTVDLDGYRGSPFSAVIHNGVGDLTLRVPKAGNAKIRLHQGVGDVEADGLAQTDEYYTTAGFNPALPVTEITITQGVGSIELEAV